nr:zinc finger, CCHC-type [Tanacetum cinerariifolium]
SGYELRLVARIATGAASEAIHGPRFQHRLQHVGIDAKGFLEFFDCSVRDKGAQGNHEAEVFQVSNDDAAVAQRWLEDKQLEERTNMYCLVKEYEKVHFGIKVEADITVTEVPGQEGPEGNVAGRKKKMSKEAKLGESTKVQGLVNKAVPGSRFQH